MDQSKSESTQKTVNFVAQDSQGETHLFFLWHWLSSSFLPGTAVLVTSDTAVDDKISVLLWKETDDEQIAQVEKSIWNKRDSKMGMRFVIHVLLLVSFSMWSGKRFHKVKQEYIFQFFFC